MSFFISDAMAAGEAGAQQGNPLISLLMLVGMGIFFYFIMLRPQIKRQKEHKQMVTALSKGDEVQSIGGLMGKVTYLNDHYIKIEIAPNTEVALRRQSIETVLPKGTLKDLK